MGEQQPPGAQAGLAAQHARQHGSHDWQPSHAGQQALQPGQPISQQLLEGSDGTATADGGGKGEEATRGGEAEEDDESEASGT